MCRAVPGLVFLFYSRRVGLTRKALFEIIKKLFKRKYGRMPD